MTQKTFLKNLKKILKKFKKIYGRSVGRSVRTLSPLERCPAWTVLVSKFGSFFFSFSLFLSVSMFLGMFFGYFWPSSMPSWGPKSSIWTLTPNFNIGAWNQPKNGPCLSIPFYFFFIFSHVRWFLLILAQKTHLYASGAVRGRSPVAPWGASRVHTY